MSHRKRVLATALAAAVVLSPAASPATALPAPVVEQVDEHQINSLSLEIKNDPRLLALGFTNNVAYLGAQIHANVVAPGAEKLEYYWLSTYDHGPSDDHTEEGSDFTVDGTDRYYPGKYKVHVRATWANGDQRMATVPLTIDYARSTGVITGAPASVRPGTAISGTVFQPDAMTLAVGGRDAMKISWWGADTEYKSSYTKPQATGDTPFIVQPSWRGKHILARVSVPVPLGWIIPTQYFRIPVEDVAPAPVKASLPAFVATHPHRAFEAKVTNITPGTVQETQWIHNGKVARDFTGDFGFEFHPSRGSLPGDTLQVKVRSVYKDGTITEPVLSNKVVLSTPAFKAPPVTITGTATVGERLTAVRGLGYVPPTVKSTRTWLRNGKAIPGATSSTYKLTAADADARISVTTRYKPFDRAAVTSTSRATGTVKRLEMRAPYLHVSGTNRPGKTLTVKSYDAKAGAVIKYQWLRDGKAIKGATKSSYKLTKSDAKKRVAVKGTTTFPGYKTTVTTSRASLVATR